MYVACIFHYPFTHAARWKLQSSDRPVQAHSSTQMVPFTRKWSQKEWSSGCSAFCKKNDLAVLPRQRKGHNIVGERGGGSFSSVTIIPFNWWEIKPSVSIKRAAEHTNCSCGSKAFYGNLESEVHLSKAVDCFTSLSPKKIVHEKIQKAMIFLDTLYLLANFYWQLKIMRSVNQGHMVQF